MLAEKQAGGLREAEERWRGFCTGSSGTLVGENTSPVFWKQKLVEGGEEVERQDMFLHEHRAAQLGFLPSAGGPWERVGTGL